MSLHTDSEREAQRKAASAWEQMLAYWEARAAGNSEEAEQFYEAARALAKARGFRFLPVAKVAELPLPELIARIEAIRFKDGKPDRLDVAALMGSAPVPQITVSRAVQIYWDLTRDRLIKKSPDQVRRWENPRKKAIALFIKTNGDLPLSEIGPDHMEAFRSMLVERVEDGQLSPGSANKDIGHFSEIVRTVIRRKSLGISPPLSGYMLADKDRQTRLPFSEAWIIEKIIRNPALMKLNDEARFILLGMVNTGYRPSEGANLGAAQIRLDGDVPFISIEPQGRELKTPDSERIIPLTGISLDAFKAMPKGFPRYRDKAGLSATVNKFMAENGMKETPDHTMYGLRHSFEDRLLDRGVDERIRRDLMGHALTRQRYGKGASLERLHEIVQAIAL